MEACKDIVPVRSHARTLARYAAGMPKRTVAYDLIAIGDATVDVFLKIHDASVQCTLDQRNCLLCFRYADKVPVEGITETPAAGNAANNAVGSARLGLAAALVTVLGDDDAGRGIRKELKNNRVALPYVTRDRRRRTNYSVVLSYRGERTILVYHAPRTYRLPKLASAFWVYLTSMGQGWERIIPSLITYQARAGARLAFNPGTHQLRSGLAVLGPLLTRTSVLLVNREEAAFLLNAPAGTEPERLLRRLSDLGPKTVVLTDGPEGSYALHDREVWFVPPFPLPAVERTGAGDAFSTGFLAAMLYGTGVAEAQRWGTLNAGSVTQYIGPQAGLLTLSGMRKMLKRYPKVVAKPL